MFGWRSKPLAQNYQKSQYILIAILYVKIFSVNMALEREKRRIDEKQTK